MAAVADVLFTPTGLAVVRDELQLQGPRDTTVAMQIFRLRDPVEATKHVLASSVPPAADAASVLLPASAEGADDVDSDAASSGSGSSTEGDDGSSSTESACNTGSLCGTDSDSDGDTVYSEIVEDIGDRELWAYVWGTAPWFSGVLLSIGLQGETVVELGGGCCVAGVAAGMAGATSVLCSDYLSSGFEVGLMTATANGVDHCVSFQTFNWEEPVATAMPQCSLVIGSDVLYLPSAGPHILRAIKDLLLPGGTCLIADPGRAAGDNFLRLCREDPHVLTHNHSLVHTGMAAMAGADQVLRVIEVFKPVESVPSTAARPDCTTVPTELGARPAAGGPTIPSRIHAALQCTLAVHKATPPGFQVTVF